MQTMQSLVGKKNNNNKIYFFLYKVSKLRLLTLVLAPFCLMPLAELSRRCNSSQCTLMEVSGLALWHPWTSARELQSSWIYLKATPEHQPSWACAALYTCITSVASRVHIFPCSFMEQLSYTYAIGFQQVASLLLMYKGSVSSVSH